MFRLSIQNAVGLRSDTDFQRMLHHLARLGAEVHNQHGANGHEAVSISFASAVQTANAQDVTGTVKALGRHLLDPTSVHVTNDAGEDLFFIGPGADKAARETYLRLAALYATKAGEKTLAEQLRGKGGH